MAQARRAQPQVAPPPRPQARGAGPLVAPAGPAPAAPLDVRAFACPITWVKTRIALERLGVGERLEVWLGAGEPASSVPRTAEEEGHRVLLLEPLPGSATGVAPGAFRLLLQKGAPPASPVVP